MRVRVKLLAVRGRPMPLGRSFIDIFPGGRLHAAKHTSPTHYLPQAPTDYMEHSIPSQICQGEQDSREYACDGEKCHLCQEDTHVLEESVTFVHVGELSTCFVVKIEGKATQ